MPSPKLLRQSAGEPKPRGQTCKRSRVEDTIIKVNASEDELA